MDLLVLMFVTGFAVATLIFWPMLHRANRRLAETGVSDAGYTPKGKHALRPPATPKVIPRRREAEEQPAPAEAKAEPEPQVETETKAEAEPEPSESASVAPQQRAAERIEMPALPTDLFEKHFEAKFNRSRQRLARLRSEINKP
ncbi:hypothetical protein MOQ72_01860 [Saccharopolyspora sp. K220]|uniref:hypothetical protein n=1 Tax=Saccharopolyspora soli TaxID=2926618 RepID=UPI001F5989B5|nr:hypothetical protein [Saccharopolyspora soli]MCI2416155.1 hypothetical protein [Saccharopolyspora soli]